MKKEFIKIYILGKKEPIEIEREKLGETLVSLNEEINKTIDERGSFVIHFRKYEKEDKICWMEGRKVCDYSF